MNSIPISCSILVIHYCYFDSSYFNSISWFLTMGPVCYDNVQWALSERDFLFLHLSIRYCLTTAKRRWKLHTNIMVTQKKDTVLPMAIVV